MAIDNRGTEPRTDPPEPRYICCPECGGEVYEHEIMIQWVKDYICVDCVIKELTGFRKDPELLAQITCSKTKTVTEILKGE